MAAVRAELAYFTRPPPGAPVPVMGSKETRHSLTVKHDVAIADARALPMELQANGVELFRHRTALVDWEDKAEVREVYYAEIAALVQRATGADFVLPYNHITRHAAADNFTQARSTTRARPQTRATCSSTRRPRTAASRRRTT